jgi:putative membrane protein
METRHMIKRYFPHFLAFLFCGVFIILGIEPVSRTVWIAEVIPVLIVFCLLAATFKKFRFSNLSYALMSFWLFWHTVGGHYTFANVPFGWVTDLLGSDRNHFDRIGHFSIGFYAYPLAELALKKKWCTPVTAGFLGLFFIMSIAAGYEMIEWWYAVAEGGEAGIEFLGSQGDIWDAQKDMLSDTLGAIFSLGLFWIFRPHKRL